MANGFMTKMAAKMKEKSDKNANKEKNYTLHIVGTIVIVALVITCLTYWFPF